jgi:diguanylate cyclase (GGDEF)-like protein/PAS domain S-box-containing protein
MRAFSRLGRALPKGRTLPPAVWERRHAWMLRLVWAHAVALFGWGLLAGHPVWHAAVDGAPVAICAVIAGRRRVSRRNRAVAVCVGLLTSSAVVVHLMNGAIEGHFHFFVMVSVLALYEDWFPYLLAFAFVLGHHGLMGVLEPSSVYNHPDAVAHPWRWAGIHALFIAALGIVNVVHWRLNEEARADALHSRERFRHAFDDAPIGMALTGLDGVVDRANAVLCERIGADPAGRPLAELVDADDLAGRPFPADGGEIEVRYAGTAAWGLWHHSPLTGRDGRPEAWISHCIDVSKRRFAEDELSWQANHDALTGLPNRELFMERLSGSLSSEGRVAVLLVDLDDFKVVNDSLGHAAGDRLLSGVAERLCRVLRPGDVIARFGGDEFTVLLPGITDEAYALGVARRLAEALRDPLVLDGERRYVTASVGMSFSASGEHDPHALLRDADAAMYRAKDMGKSRCEVFDDSMRERAMERLELESGLRHALEDGELRLVYQPLVTLDDGRISGVEALLRWDHPIFGMVAPLRFIGLAERNGLIIPIGAWVLGEACRQLAAWGDDALSVSVNVSARQLGSTDLVDVVRAALEDSGIDPRRLCLEITETAMMADPGAIGETLCPLKALGVRLAVDDFGVGHASLRQLRALLPVDTLKIDKSFVDGITDDADDAAIVEGVVRLAHSLGLQAVAEGVETAEQVAMLRTFSCQTGQGYHFARPAEPEAIARMLSAGPAAQRRAA